MFITAIAAVVLYNVLTIGSSLVELQLETDNVTTFRMYYKKIDEPWTQQQVASVTIKPGQKEYSFRIPRLANIDLLRIDTSEKPAVVTIRSLSISQEGCEPLVFASDSDFEQLKPIEGIASAVINNGLTVTPATEDPQLHYTLDNKPVFSFTKLHWLPSAALFGAVCLLVFLGRPLFVEFRFTTYIGFAVIILIMAMAVVSIPNRHPDEHVHIAAGQYYMDHWLPPVVGSAEVEGTYSDYGISRLHSGEIVYLIAGKFASLFSELSYPDFLILRLFNVFLFSIIILTGIRSYEMRILMLPLFLSPQVWYVFSYFNSDAFAVFMMIMAAYQCIRQDSWFNRILDGDSYRFGPVRILFIGILLGLLLLTKINFYFFVLFVGGYVLWKMIFRDQKLNRPVITRIVSVVLVAVMLFGGMRFLDQWVNDFDKKARVAKAQEAFALEQFKPSTPLDKKFLYLQLRDRGTSFRGIIGPLQWGEKTFRSAVGEYGYMNVSATAYHYNLVRYSMVALLVVSALMIILRTGWAGISLLTLIFGCLGALIGAVLYHCWTVDFQAQGRYLLPLIGMMGIVLYETRRAVSNLLATICYVWIIGLSFYSYIFFALAGIGKITGSMG